MCTHRYRYRFYMSVTFDYVIRLRKNNEYHWELIMTLTDHRSTLRIMRKTSYILNKHLILKCELPKQVNTSGPSIHTYCNSDSIKHDYYFTRNQRLKDIHISNQLTNKIIPGCVCDWINNLHIICTIIN